MSKPPPKHWIEIGCFDPPRFKSHFYQYSSVWFYSIEEALAWCNKLNLEQKVVDTPKAAGVEHS